VPRHLLNESFLIELMKNSEEWRAMKLVVLGNGRIGKTTLLQSLKKLIPNTKVLIERGEGGRGERANTELFCSQVNYHQSKAQLELIVNLLSWVGVKYLSGILQDSWNTLPPTSFSFQLSNFLLFCMFVYFIFLMQLL